MAKVVVFGTGMMAKMAHFYLSHDSPHEVVAFTVDAAYASGESFLGLPLVSFENIESLYPPNKFSVLVALGYKKLNAIRAQKYSEVKKRGYECINYVSTKATHWGDTLIGDNCFILEHQVIQPGVKIGSDVVIWSGNHFGHDVVIGDHCWISSHAVLSGGVAIGDHSFVGVNATFRDGVRIGRECIIGAGALMLRDAPDRAVYVAQPTERYRLDSAAFERMMDISRG